MRNNFFHASTKLDTLISQLFSGVIIIMLSHSRIKNISNAIFILRKFNIRNQDLINLYRVFHQSVVSQSVIGVRKKYKNLCLSHG
jgi:hypothetical protein